MSIESVIPYSHLILCRPLLFLPSVFPSIKVFSKESVLCIRWPKYWSFSFNISPSNDYSGLISFRIDWLDLFVVQGTLKSLLQHHSSKALLVVREMQIKTMRRYHLTLVRMAIIKKSTNNKWWRWCGEKGTLLHCWWECKLIQSLWKMVWRFLKNLGIKPPYDPAIPLLGIYPEETKIEKKHKFPNVHCSTIYNS